MSCNLDPLNNPVDACRLLVGDYDDLQILTDDDYRYFLKLQSNNVVRAAVQAAQAILFRFSQFSDETIGPLRFRGEQIALAYKAALIMFINNPNINGSAINSAMPYGGGISIADIRKNISNVDNLVPSITRSVASESSEYPSYYPETNPFNSNTLPRQTPFGVNSI